MKPFVVASLGAVLAGACKSPEKSADPWYTAYFESPLSTTATFHSELELAAGEQVDVQVRSDDELVIGFTLEKGYEVFKSGGSVWLGTAEKPHTVGGAPGVSNNFTPRDGTVTLTVENDSPVATRIAIFTQPAEQD